MNYERVKELFLVMVALVVTIKFLYFFEEMKLRRIRVMKNYFLKFKDEQKWIKVIANILQFVWVLPAFAALAALGYNIAYGITGLIFAACINLFGKWLERYGEKVNHYIYSIESDSFNMLIDMREFQLRGTTPFPVEINGTTVSFYLAEKDFQFPKGVVRLWTLRTIYNGMTIDFGGEPDSTNLSINDVKVVERNIINFEALEKVMQSQNKTQN